MEGYYRSIQLPGYADNETVCLCSACADKHEQNDFWEPIMEPDTCELCLESVFGEEERKFINFLKNQTSDSENIYEAFLHNLKTDIQKRELHQLFRDEKFKKEYYIINAFHWGKGVGGRAFWLKLHNTWIDLCFPDADETTKKAYKYKLPLN